MHFLILECRDTDREHSGPGEHKKVEASSDQSATGLNESDNHKYIHTY